MKPRRPPLTPIRTAALLICTRDRPDGIADTLRACASLIRLPGLSIAICVADNNTEPQEESIRWSGVENGLDLRYDHEPRRGYASVRNRALALALAADADIAIFIDDDCIPTPGLVVEHVEAMLRYGADAIVGSIEGIERIEGASDAGKQMQHPQEGRRVFTARPLHDGTGNVSMRRWVFDPAGAGIRFDDRLDLLGFEGSEFFGDLIRAGGEIFLSTRPVSIRPPGLVQGLAQGLAGFERPYAARRAFAVMEGCNEIAAARIRHGWCSAAAKAMAHHVPLIARGVAGIVSARLSTEHGTEANRIAAEAARLSVVRGSAALSGLWRPGYERLLAPREAGELKHR